MRDDVALVERHDARSHRAGLAKDASHKLGHGAQVRACGQGTEHIGERAVPPLLESLLGNDRPYAVRRRQKILVLGLIQVVPLGRLDGNFGLVEPGMGLLVIP